MFCSWIEFKRWIIRGAKDGASTTAGVYGRRESSGEIAKTEEVNSSFDQNLGCGGRGLNWKAYVSLLTGRYTDRRRS